MKIRKISAIILMVTVIIMISNSVTAREGDMGYEGGISSGETLGATSYEYKEPIFLTGKPIMLTGTVTIKKSLKDDLLTTTYTYKLKNSIESASMTRVMILSTTLSEKSNGQVIEETLLGSRPSEIIKVGKQTFTLINYTFTRTNIIDKKPAINYYSGNTWGKKTYRTGNTLSGNTITVESTGSFYGYDQYWGMTETGEFDIVIESNQKTGDVFDEWGGTANISFSNSISRKIKYVDNEPEQISFRGGYIEMVNNNSILSYTAKLPEFDKDNVSTDNIIDYEDSAMIETFPSQRRLLVPDLSHIRGHWAEEDIKIMFSLEVFDMDEEVFNPSKYVTRGEFTKAFINAAKEVPDDPALAKTTRTTNRNTETEEEQESIFPDVSKDNEFYESIESAYNREIIYGRYDGNFYPDDPITVAESVTIFIRTLGLENMAPNPTPVTIFKDHDEIPEYARPYIYVAYTIGLINGDTKGYLKPNDYISYSRFAAMLRRFIGYMNDGIKEDYRENIVNY